MSHDKDLLRTLGPLLALAAASTVSAQPGAVTGTVNDATSVVVGARVSIDGTTHSGRSGADGRYLILNVPPGTYTLRVQMQGYAAAQQQVTVGGGEAARADFAITAVRNIAPASTETFDPGGQHCDGKPVGAECWQPISEHHSAPKPCYLWNPNYQGADEVAFWSGRCIGGLAHGLGTITWIVALDSGFVVGRLERGLLQGWSRYVDSDGTSEGPYVDGKRHGDWTHTYADGGTSEGPYVDGKRHGVWEHAYADGGTGQGLYVDGKRHGVWFLTKPSGERQKGPFVDGNPQGTWEIWWTNGEYGKGPLDGVMQGTWTITRADGTRCSQPYRDGQPIGRCSRQ